MTWRESLQPLQAAEFRYYLIARTVDLFGNTMAPVAVAFAVLHIGGSATDLGLVLAARSVPLVVFTLYGGVIADRMGRDRVLVTACVLSGVVQGLAAYLLIGDLATVALLAFVEAVHGTVSAFTMPAVQGVVPLLVERDRLQHANALAAVGRNAAIMTGPAVGGILVATAGAGWALAVDALTFVVAGVLFARLRLPHDAVLAGSSILSELKDGWAEFVSRTWVWVIVLGFGVLNALWACAWVTLGPVVADETIGADGWGLVLTGQAVGLMVGTLLLLRLRVRHPLRLGMVGVTALCLPMLMLGVAPQLGLLLISACVAGVGMDLFGITWETALQQHVPVSRLSRVTAYDVLGSIVAVPIGQIAAGPLVAVFELRSVLLGCATVYVSVALAVLAVPAVWRLRAESTSVVAGDGAAA
ncbi:MAG TPA: MFS transporter [Nocardioidaceae bacterium]|nr:MFS transporter [Nocardioidaceae bacterium]